MPVAGPATAPAEVFGALPWQTISSGEIPNVREFIAARSQDAVSGKPESVRIPAIMLIPASAFALTAVLLIGGNVAAIVAIVRCVLEMTLAVTGIRAARRDGQPRRRASTLARTTASVQLASIALLVVQTLQDRGTTPAFTLTLIAIGACLALTLRIAALATNQVKR